jgi:hypothetical protein
MRDPGTSWRPSWKFCVSVVLIFTVLAQSLLTVACDLDDFVAGNSAGVIVAVELPATSDVDAGICAPCGGFATAGGCCAHGIALSPILPGLFAVKSAPRLPVPLASDLPQDAPSDLLRPPIAA